MTDFVSFLVSFFELNDPVTILTLLLVVVFKAILITLELLEDSDS